MSSSFRSLTRLGSITMDKSPLEKSATDLSDLLEAGMEDFEDKLFDLICDSQQRVTIMKFIELLHKAGLRDDDPRLKEAMEKFHKIEMKQLHEDTGLRGMVEREDFHACIADNLVVIAQALKNQFVIPEWDVFVQHILKIYNTAKYNKDGTPAQYIPQLARVNPDYWGVAVCSVDGQRFSVGDTHIPFSIQSVVKPLNYALVLNDLTPDVVHKYVGQEPSGRSFNELTLDYQHKPHNPMINAGAIVVASLLKNTLKIADRFDYQQTESIEEDRKRTLAKQIDQMRRLAGNEHVAFNNSVYLSERATADRNFALGYYMRENNCFPEGTDLHEVLEFYFQLCSLEINCESGAVIAATLANGGICPTTGDKILDPVAVRNTLSLMHSCGMYDYSGQFAFKVGLPAKSGVSGGIMLVVPNVMGIYMYSPPLDVWGNSCRGVEFCQELVADFNFHNYDNLKHTTKKYDPRSRKIESKGQDVVNLLFSAFNGDVTAMRRYALLGMDMSLADYDGRTALHLAAAEGHEHVVKFLVEKCKTTPFSKDRWGFTPYDDAVRFKHESIANYLDEQMKNNPEINVQQVTKGLDKMSVE